MTIIQSVVGKTQCHKRPTTRQTPNFLTMFSMGAKHIPTWFMVYGIVFFTYIIIHRCLRFYEVEKLLLAPNRSPHTYIYIYIIGIHWQYGCPIASWLWFDWTRSNAQDLWISDQIQANDVEYFMCSCCGFGGLWSLIGSRTILTLGSFNIAVDDYHWKWDQSSLNGSGFIARL